MRCITGAAAERISVAITDAGWCIVDISPDFDEVICKHQQTVPVKPWWSYYQNDIAIFIKINESESQIFFISRRLPDTGKL